jgi:hypothetical protein
MTLTGLHLLLTYKCNFECDHCFAWGSPWQEGTMTLEKIRRILEQGKNLGTIEWIYYEGGEPFLYYAALLRAVRMAAELEFDVGIVSNGYWATDVKDGLEWLRPLAGLVQDLSISTDAYHGNEDSRRQAQNAHAAAVKLGIPVGIISVAQPEKKDAPSATGQLPCGECAVMYRGRAAEKLAEKTGHQPWMDFTECPFEDLHNPERVHVDAYGYLHICQGISMGNLFRTTLGAICDAYDPDAHPIVGPLLRGGPAEVVRRYDLPHQEAYADACHLCCEARRALRTRFPHILAPDEMYGVPAEEKTSSENLLDR